MSDAAFIAAAARLGLTAVRHQVRTGRDGEPPPVFWMLSRDGEDVGSYVPHSCSVHIRGRRLVSVAGDESALVAFAKEIEGRAR